MIDSVDAKVPINELHESRQNKVVNLTRNKYDKFVDKALLDIESKGKPYSPDTHWFFKTTLPEVVEDPGCSFSVSIHDSDLTYLLLSPDEKSDRKKKVEKSKKSPVQFSSKMNSPVTDIPVLEIKDVKRFADAIENLSKVMRSVDQIPWTKMKDLQHRIEPYDSFLATLFFHATPYDFHNPIEYINRIAAELKDSYFINLDNGVDLGFIPSVGKHLYVRRTQAMLGYETPYKLDYYLPPEGEEPKSQAYTLPSIRYAVDTHGKAYIYASQMDKLVTLDPKFQNEYRELLDDQINRVSTYFRNHIKNHSFELVGLLGEIPDDILAIPDDEKFLTTLLIHLQKSKPEIFHSSDKYPPIWSWYYKLQKKTYENEEEYKNSVYYRLPEELVELRDCVRDLSELPSFLKEPLQRKKLLNSLYALDRGLEKDDDFASYKKKKEANTLTENDQYPENVIDVFRPGLVSMAATLALLQKNGIHDVVVPVYLPLRWQNHLFKYAKAKEYGQDINPIEESERIQRNTTDGFIRIFRRLSEQVTGIEITAYPDEDGFMRLRLSEQELKSDNEVFREILQAVYSYEEKK